MTPEPFHILIYCAGLFWFGLVLWHHVLDDVELWSKKLPKTHGWPAIRERGIHLIPSIVCLSMFHPFPWSGSAFLDGLLTAPLAAFMLACVWLTLFDGFYNTIRTRTGLSRVFGWWDVGDAFDPNEPDQSWTDQFFATKPVWLRAVIKISLIAVSITLYLLPYFIE